MTSFNIRLDDSGIRNLRNERRKPHNTKAVGEISPYPTIHATQTGIKSTVELDYETHQEQHAQEDAPQAELILRESEERRHVPDRRQQQESVLLDTRNKSERRQLAHNLAAELENDDSEEHKGLGIDIYT